MEYRKATIIKVDFELSDAEKLIDELGIYCTEIDGLMGLLMKTLREALESGE